MVISLNLFSYYRCGKQADKLTTHINTSDILTKITALIFLTMDADCTFVTPADDFTGKRTYIAE